MKTKEKILEASMTLFMTHGYKKTTTKLIAKEAGVNEVTVFRLFGKKKNIIEEIIDLKMMDMVPLNDYFDQASYNLEEDLYQSSMLYYKAMVKNLPLMMALLDELDQDFARVFSKLPSQVIKIYSNYFYKLREMNLIGDYDPKTLGKSFNTMVSGFAMTKVLTKDHIIDESEKDFLKINIKIFSKGISA